MKPINSNTDQQNEQKQPAKEAAAKANPDLRDLVIPVPASEVAQIRDFAGVSRRLAVLRPADHMFFKNHKVDGAATTDLTVSRGVVLGWRSAEVGVIGKVGVREIAIYEKKDRVGAVPLPAKTAEVLTAEDLIALPDGSVNTKGELRVRYFAGAEDTEPCVQIETAGRRFGTTANGIGFWIHPTTVYAAATLLDAHPDAHAVKITVWWHYGDGEAAPAAASQPEGNAALLAAALA